MIVCESHTNICPATDRAPLRPKKHVLEIQLQIRVYSGHIVGHRCVVLFAADGFHFPSHFILFITAMSVNRQYNLIKSLIQSQP